MSTYQPPKKNTEYIRYVDLVSQANTNLFQVNPTIASGDFKVSTDGGAFANLSTLPVVTPSGGTSVKVTLSASEMNGDNIKLQCRDAAGAEWCDLSINIATAARQIDDLAFPNTSGRGMVVDAAGLVDANTVKVGPTGAGTAQTAKDVGAINVTNINTLSSHDPGATLGTSTYAGADTAGTTTLLSRVTAAVMLASSYTAPPSAATIAAAVWDYLTSAATTANSIGKRLVDFMTSLVYVAPDNTGIGNAAASASTAATQATAAAASAASADSTVNDGTYGNAALLTAIGSGGGSGDTSSFSGTAADDITLIKRLAQGAESGGG